MDKISICQFCGQSHGVHCPSVKAIEYFEDGKVKRVEFMTAVDYHPVGLMQNPISSVEHVWPNPLWGPTITRGQ